LRTADARVLVEDSQSRVRLALRYTTFAPADVAVAYRLSGGRGTLPLGSAKAHFTQSGVFRLTERLGRGDMERVRAARRFTVTIDVPAAPGHCARYSSHRLTVRHAAHGQVAWVQAVPR
jgi:hypothetical protein